MPHRELGAAIRARCSRTSSCRVRVGERRAPLVRQPKQDCYCKRVWPVGSIVCVPAGTTGIDSALWAFCGHGGEGTTAAQNAFLARALAPTPDIQGTGRFLTDVGAREAAAGITERAQQDIATVLRDAEAGRIPPDVAAARVEAAELRARTASKTAAQIGPSGLTPPTTTSGSKLADGDVVHADELRGVCNQPQPGPVFCRTTWPGGFLGLDRFGNPPRGPWVPAVEQREAKDITDPKTGQVTHVTVARLVKAPECFPQEGTPWWSSSGAWVARVILNAGTEASTLTRAVASDVAARVRKVSAATQQALPGALGGTPTAPATGGPCTSYCKTIWPGGVTCWPDALGAPPGPWVPGDGSSSACYHA